MCNGSATAMSLDSMEAFTTRPSAERQFAKALISASALMVMAADKATPQSVAALGQVLVGNQHIQKQFKVEEACDLYIAEINHLKQAHQPDAVIKRIAVSVEDRLWRDEVLSAAELAGITNVDICMDDTQRSVLARLQAALA